MPTSIELFTGAGGLALGVAAAGFDHQMLVEYNRDACRSLRINLAHLAGEQTALHEGDVRQVNFDAFRDRVDLLAAGAPCQPFSIGGKHRAHSDERNLFPEVFRAVAAVRPKAVVIENVKGLLRESFRPYVDYIELQLSRPDVQPLDAEDWGEHAAVLRALQSEDTGSNLRYVVRKQLLNAADFGVPQRRERVFIVAVRADLEEAWPGLSPTHSEDALLYEQWVTGEYWKRHRIARPGIPQQLERRVERLAMIGRPATKPWRTVRDALAESPRLGEPTMGSGTKGVLNHVGQPGARSYPGHTGSPVDEPAKTLKAGVHGVPGGENMLRQLDGTVRYFTIREAARMQSFPDDYVIEGSWSEALRQLGNAVPMRLAQAVAQSVRDLLERHKMPSNGRRLGAKSTRLVSA